MEFVEAPAFTKFVKNYLEDDDYADLQRRLEQEPEAGDLIPGQAVCANCDGVTAAEARAREVGYGLSTITLSPTFRYGC
jgi:hypothetical protein